jgi:hypothetical protein
VEEKMTLHQSIITWYALGEHFVSSNFLSFKKAIESLDLFLHLSDYGIVVDLNDI